MLEVCDHALLLLGVECEGLEHDGISARALDVALDHAELPLVFGRHGEDADAVLDVHSTQPTNASPDGDAHLGRFRRDLVGKK